MEPNYITIKNNGRHEVTFCWTEDGDGIYYGCSVLSSKDKTDKHKGRAIAKSRMEAIRNGIQLDWDFYDGSEEKGEQEKNKYFEVVYNYFCKNGCQPDFFSVLKDVRKELKCQN